MNGGPGRGWSTKGIPTGQPTSFIGQGANKSGAPSVIPLKSGTGQPGKSTHTSPKPPQKQKQTMGLKSTSPGPLKPTSKYKPQPFPSKPYELFVNPSSEQRPWIGSNPDPPKSLTGKTIKPKPKSSSPPKNAKQEPQISSEQTKSGSEDNPIKSKSPASSNNKKKDGDEEEEEEEEQRVEKKTITKTEARKPSVDKYKEDALKKKPIKPLPTLPPSSKPAPVVPPEKKVTEQKPPQDRKSLKPSNKSLNPKKSINKPVKVIAAPTKKENATNKETKKKSDKKEGSSSDSSDGKIIKVVQPRTEPKNEPAKDTDDDDDEDDIDDNDSEEFVKIITTRKTLDDAPDLRTLAKEPETDSEDD
jgi:hypothetical protein